MPSTRDLSALPELDDLRRLSQSLAMLDAILCPEWQYRHHSFNANWDSEEQMASMRDGSGDGYFILFTRSGTTMKGFAHESEVWRRASEREQAHPGIFDGVPEEFAGFLKEPAFVMEETTFCLWRRPSDATWQVGAIDSFETEDPDGSAELLRLLDGDPEAYRVWAEGYFETSVSRAAVDYIFDRRLMTEEVVKSLNPRLSLADLAGDLSEIAYPTMK